MKTALVILLGTARSVGWYGWLVGVPFALSVIYYGLVCSDSYVSHAQLIVERESQASMLNIEPGLLGLASTDSKLDALIIKEFMESQAMIMHLQAKHDLRSHFSAKAIDRLSRLDPEASNEDFLEFVDDRLDIQVDSESYVVSVAFEAYAPAYAQAVTASIVQRSEDFVNDISRMLARDKLDFIQAEIEEAHGRLRQASANLAALQRKHELFSPEVETETMSRIIAGLQEQLAAQKAELKALQEFMNPAAAEVLAAQRQIAALEQQLEQERAAQVGGGANGVNELLLRYKEAELSVTVASDLYQTGLKTLETVRLDALRKVKYLVLISPPQAPDEAALPQRGKSVLTIFLFLNLGFFVLRLVVATVGDHMD